MEKSKAKIVESKRKIQKKKGDQKMGKTGFYLSMLFCATLLCLGTTSYVKAENQDSTSKPEIAKRAETRDAIEDIRDRREDVRDRREDKYDRREDVRDHKEDIRDRREDILGTQKMIR